MSDFEKWKVFPQHGDDNDFAKVTGWGIFVLDPSDNGGDILPVGPEMTWENATEIVAAHNEAIDRARNGTKTARAKVIIPTNRRALEGGRSR